MSDERASCVFDVFYDCTKVDLQQCLLITQCEPPTQEEWELHGMHMLFFFLTTNLLIDV